MSAPEPDIAALGRQLQDFFNALDWRTDVRVHDAAIQLEALHGATAALEAVSKACDALAGGDTDDCQFWFQVFGFLAAPQTHDGGVVTLH